MSKQQYYSSDCLDQRINSGELTATITIVAADSNCDDGGDDDAMCYCWCCSSMLTVAGDSYQVQLTPTQVAAHNSELNSNESL